MRNFQTLDSSNVHQAAESVEFYLAAADDDQPRLAVRREGSYVTLSASYGPLEIAMRPRYEDFVRALSRLTAVEGLLTTRQVGTDHAYLALGLQTDQSLLMRLTIVADATGHFSLNLHLTPSIAKTFYEWLNVPELNGKHA